MRAAAGEHGATGMRWTTAEASDGPVDVVSLHLPNEQVGPLVGALESIEAMSVSFYPQGVLRLSPPPDEAPQQVVDVSHLSPLELLLSGLQSIGSWQGFIAYAAIAGAVVWAGLVTNTSFLLVAAMLIAPFAGPAMNTALGTARGDAMLIRRGLVRYVTALAMGIVVAAALSVAFGQSVATASMVDTTSVSAAAVLIPLVAGAAGAANLGQSDRSSLVSGAATGLLVAAALAPPAGTVGMAAVIGEWDMVRSAAFLLVLQLAGINLAGAGVFLLYGMSPSGVRYPRGRRRVRAGALAVSGVVLCGLLGWQWSSPVSLERATVSQRAEARVHRLINTDARAELVETTARFTRADVQGQNTLLVELVLQAPGDPAARERVATAVAEDVQTVLEEEFEGLVPLIDAVALPPPDSRGEG